MQLSANIQPAKLPADCRSLHSGNEYVTAIGTGRIERSKLNSRTILHQVNFTTMPNKKCAQKASFLNRPSMICGDVMDGKSIADGDSGI